MGVRVLRGLARDAGAARGQGGERRRDEAHRRAGARPRRLHDHDRGLRRIHACGRHLPGRARATGRRGARTPRAADRQASRRLAATRCSCRFAPAARESMPGMLDTVLNLGLGDRSVQGLIAHTGNERFGWDSYRRFVQMFGTVVRGVDSARFEDAIKALKEKSAAQARHRPRRGGAGAADDRVHRDLRGRDRRGLPAGAARAAAPGDPRDLRLLERRARGALPSPQPHPRRVGDGRQRAADGVRQQGRYLRLRGRLQPQPDDRRAHAVRRLPPERAGRGRRLRSAQHARAGGARRSCCRTSTRSCSTS